MERSGPSRVVPGLIVGRIFYPQIRRKKLFLSMKVYKIYSICFSVSFTKLSFTSWADDRKKFWSHWHAIHWFFVFNVCIYIYILSLYAMKNCVWLERKRPTDIKRFSKTSKCCHYELLSKETHVKPIVITRFMPITQFLSCAFVRFCIQIRICLSF